MIIGDHVGLLYAELAPPTKRAAPTSSPRMIMEDFPHHHDQRSYVAGSRPVILPFLQNACDGIASLAEEERAFKGQERK